MKRWSALAVLLIFAAALALRLPNLSVRPLHNDEAVNVIKVAELWQTGRYKYDPDEYHGPTLHYATVPFLWASRAKNPNELPDAALRLATVFFGAGLILLLLLFRGGIRHTALLWSAIFTAISPAMVFYSRYFIHEMLLVFFTALTLGAGWRYTQTRSPLWAALAGGGVGLMYATKETFVITMAAITFAAAITAWQFKPSRDLLNWRHITLALASALIIWLLFFSSFFTNFNGLSDSIRTYFPWLKRAGGHSPHIHPWYFYLQRLAWFHPAKGPAWSEGFILILALFGTIVALKSRISALNFFLALYTLSLAAAYAIIPYKTPWCLLSFYHGMILLAGLGVVEFFRVKSLRYAMPAFLVALSLHLTWQAWRASYIYAADRRNPYVYAQTVPDILNLVQRAEGLARVSPQGFDTIVKVITSDGDYWPLPWYLRRFKTIGWFDTPPDDSFAPIVIASANLKLALDEKSERKWIMDGLTELRPQRFLEMYVELELWKKYVATLPKPKDDE